MAGEHEAVILAAGPSTGFGSLTTNKHKCMLDVGGTTIIEHQIEKSNAGRDSLTIRVRGHRTQSPPDRALPALRGLRRHLRLQPVVPDDEHATGLWLTKKSELNLVILYGDIIFDPMILRDLLAAEGDVVLAVERRTTFDEEDEKVVLVGGPRGARLEGSAARSGAWRVHRPREADPEPGRGASGRRSTG